MPGKYTIYTNMDPVSAPFRQITACLQGLYCHFRLNMRYWQEAMYRLKQDNHIFRNIHTSLLTILIALALWWYRFEGVFCSYFCHLRHIVWQLRIHAICRKKCPIYQYKRICTSFYSLCINWPVKFEFNTIDWPPRGTQKYTMYVSLAFIDTFQSTLNAIIKTHFCSDMVTITDSIFKYIFFSENIWIFNISLKHVPCALIENMSALVQIMA